jgi:membrane protease subunit HflC
MKQILDRANIRADQGNFGVTYIDVRIMRADLPDTVEAQVFGRMIADREEETNRNLGDGSRQAQQIRAEAKRTAEVTVANAQKEAELIKAEGDAEQNRIYAEAYGQDPDFFAFYRSMEALRKGLGENTSYVLSPDSDLLSYLRDDGGRRR